MRSLTCSNTLRPSQSNNTQLLETSDSHDERVANGDEVCEVLRVRAIESFQTQGLSASRSLARTTRADDLDR